MNHSIIAWTGIKKSWLSSLRRPKKASPKCLARISLKENSPARRINKIHELEETIFELFDEKRKSMEEWDHTKHMPMLQAVTRIFLRHEMGYQLLLAGLLRNHPAARGLSLCSYRRRTYRRSLLSRRCHLRQPPGFPIRAEIHQASNRIHWCDSFHRSRLLRRGRSR